MQPASDLHDKHTAGRRASDMAAALLQPTGWRRQQWERLLSTAKRPKLSDWERKRLHFTAQLTTKLDPALPPAAVVPKDLGRVLLNLCTNALHALLERQRDMPDPSYAPELTLTTQAVPSAIEIRVRDNGVEMSDHVCQSILQPFFTTEPLGEGTGLGLALSFDIVTKGHGGNLAVHTAEGIGTEFIIRLPQA